MKECDSYPYFEDNQVLTSEELNRLAQYLEGQALRTRLRLTGAGIVCGLELTVAKSPELAIVISKGTGVTTEGRLITTETASYTHLKQYKDAASPVYEKFSKEDSTQVDLWELLTKTEADAEDEAVELNEDFLTDKAVILYLQKENVDLTACTGDDCDEKGIRVEFCVKKLLISVNDLTRITRSSLGLATSESLEERVRGRFSLPDISIGRQCVGLQAKIGKDGPGIKYGDIHSQYLKVIEDAIEQAWAALGKSYEVYSAALSREFASNPFSANVLKVAFESFKDENKPGIQYFYDFIKDLIRAYDEFRAAAFDLSYVCCIDEGLFPRHLMLGEASGRRECVPSVLRQPFIPVPLDGQGVLLEKTLTLFRRMVLMVRSFEVPEVRKIIITPGVDNRGPLGMMPIPYYYSPSHGLNKVWDFVLQRTCRADRALSYWTSVYAGPATPRHVTSPLEYDIDRYGFFRIEGHLGRKYEDVMLELISTTRELNVPVAVVALKLGERPTASGLRLTCSEDLGLIYATLRAEVLCLLDREKEFFANFKTGGEGGGGGTGVPDKTTGGIKGVVRMAQGVKITIISKDRLRKVLQRDVTDEKGAFSFVDLFPGAYTLLAEEEDLDKYFMRIVSVVAGRDTQVIITANQFKTRSELERELEGKGSTKAAESSLIKFLSERVDDTVGAVYGNFKEYGDGDFLKFVKNYPGLHNVWERVSKGTDVIKIYYPVQVLDRLVDLQESFPLQFEQFDFGKASSLYDSLLVLVKSYIGQIEEDLKDPKYKGDGNEAEILAHLKKLRGTCAVERFSALVDIYKKRLAEAARLVHFGHFAHNNPSIEHLGGAPRGGTFIVVYDEESKVVADFALPHTCCSECPPIAFVIPVQPLVLSLPKSLFCRKEDKEYAFAVSPAGGEVKGPGVSKGSDGDWYFNPSKAPAGEVAFTYEAAFGKKELKVEVIEINPDFVYTVSPPGADPAKRAVSFIPMPEDADRYDWDFGDGKKSTAARANNTYDISVTQEFEVRLGVTKKGCVEQTARKIKIPFCTADFSFEKKSVSNKTALVEFSSVMEGAVYDWDFDDGKPHGKEQNVLHTFDVSSKQSFNVKLKVTKDGSTAEKTQAVAIQPCNASFTVTLVSPSGNGVEARFVSAMPSADEYSWDFGDGNGSKVTAFQVAHTYRLDKIARTVTAALTVRKGVCSDSYSHPVRLPAAPDLTIDLEKTVFCKKEDRSYKFVLKTPGGKVAGAGVYEKNAGFYFNPARDDVKAGVVVFTYSLPGGPSSTLNVEVLDPRALFKVQMVAVLSNSMFRVLYENVSANAKSYIWKINGSTVAEGPKPEITVKAKSGDKIKLMLVAKDRVCEDAFEQELVMPAAPRQPRIVIDALSARGNLIRVSEGRAPVVESGGGMGVNIEMLKDFKANPLFSDATGGASGAFAGTKSNADAVRTDFENPSVAKLYAAGEKDRETAERLGKLFDLSFGDVKKLAGEPPKVRQFAYNLFLIQLNQLLTIAGTQKDISPDSPLVALFDGVSKKIREMKTIVEVDPDGKLTGMVKSAVEGAEGKQVYTEVLKRFSRAIA